MADPNLVLSCLSGTSRDGLDIGLCRVLQTRTTSQSNGYRAELLESEKAAFSPSMYRLLSRHCFSEETRVPDMMELQQAMGDFTGGRLYDFMQKHAIAPSQLLCIASHGQTLYHRAGGRQNFRAQTLQIGEADIISRMTGVPVAADFRQAHIAAGGEGAPLAPILDYYAFAPESAPVRVLINLGGIANITLLRAGQKLSEVISGDTGPANILIDQAMRRFTSGSAYDAGGELAGQGRVHSALLQRLSAHPFFEVPLPKSTGPEVFHLDWALSEAEKAGISVQHLPLPDLLATLTELSALTLAEAVQKVLPDASAFEAFGSGGGMHNYVLTRRIGHYLGLEEPLPGIDQIGGNIDFKETQLFALLGYFRLRRIRLPLFEHGRDVLLGKLSEA